MQKELKKIVNDLGAQVEFKKMDIDAFTMNDGGQIKIYVRTGFAVTASEKENAIIIELKNLIDTYASTETELAKRIKAFNLQRRINKKYVGYLIDEQVMFAFVVFYFWLMLVLWFKMFFLAFLPYAYNLFVTLFS
jgi:hypothetical protein